MSVLKTLNGNQTIAEAVRQVDPDVLAAYPITPSTAIVETIAKFKTIYEELAALPDAERRERLHEVAVKSDTIRARRAMEKPGEMKKLGFPPKDPDLRIVSGRTNFWASINAEDSAQAFEQGLTLSYEGAHPLFVNDAHNCAGVESETLARLFFPSVKSRKRPLESTESLVSIRKARELLGFEPELSIGRLFPTRSE